MNKFNDNFHVHHAFQEKEVVVLGTLPSTKHSKRKFYLLIKESTPYQWLCMYFRLSVGILGHCTDARASSEETEQQLLLLLLLLLLREMHVMSLTHNHRKELMHLFAVEKFGKINLSLKSKKVTFLQSDIYILYENTHAQ